MRSLLFAALGAVALTLAGPGVASAHDPVGGFGRHRGGFSYGPRGHDLRPHWHTTYTPYGPTHWYGNGLHDLRPHAHSVSPWGGVQSYSYTPFGPTVSYNRAPVHRSYYGGFGGYGGFPGGYGYSGGFGSPWGW